MIYRAAPARQEKRVRARVVAVKHRFRTIYRSVDDVIIITYVSVLTVEPRAAGPSAGVSGESTVFDFYAKTPIRPPSRRANLKGVHDDVTLRHENACRPTKRHGRPTGLDGGSQTVHVRGSHGRFKIFPVSLDILSRSMYTLTRAKPFIAGTTRLATTS